MKHYRTTLKVLVLALALVWALLPQRADAVDATLSGDTTVQAGSTIKLTLTVSGSNIQGIDATLDYDSDLLEFTNYDFQVGSGWTTDYNELKFVLYSASNPITSSTKVLTVTFRVKSNLESGKKLSATFKNLSVVEGTSEIDCIAARWEGTVSASLSDNCTLNSLTCSNATLSPAFSSGTTYYTATVPYSVSSLNLSYQTADSAAQVAVSGNSLVVGSNTVSVTCTAASGAKKTYSIAVTRQQDPNYKPGTDALLKELTLDIGALSPAFSENLTEYVAYVPYETSSATLSGVAHDEKATKVTESTAKLVSPGDNTMSITCTAEDGVTTKTYTVHVFRMPKYEGVLPTVEVIDPNTPVEPVEPEEPEIPSYTIPMTLTLPLLGKTATSTVAVIGGALLIIVLLLVGFLLGRIGGGNGYDDDDGGDDDRPPRQPHPERHTAPERTAAPHRSEPSAHRTVQPQPQSRPKAVQTPPAAPKRPVTPAPTAVSDDTLTSPFVEDLSAKMRQELAQRQQAAEAAETASRSAASGSKPAGDKEVSLDELLNDIRNM